MARDRTNRLAVYLEAFITARDEEARKLCAVIESDRSSPDQRFDALAALARLAVEMTSLAGRSRA